MVKYIYHTNCALSIYHIKLVNGIYCFLNATIKKPDGVNKLVAVTIYHLYQGNYLKSRR